MIGGGAHPLHFVSTSPVFCRGRNPLGIHFAEHAFEPFSETVIGNDVWLGEGCRIRAGVTVQDGAVAGMGAVVTRDVEPYSIVAGNLAREIRKRFPEDIVRRLLAVRWWDWDQERIRELAPYFNDPGQLLARIDAQTPDW